MSFKDICETDLVLGLGFEGTIENRLNSYHQSQKPCSKFDHFIPPSSTIPITNLELSLTLGLPDEMYEAARKIKMKKTYEENIDLRQQAYHASFKRERDFMCEEMEVERISSRISDEDEDGSTRKKVRLTKQQSALLEDSFKEQSTLNPTRKEVLAKQLDLRPRQIEVWFQNRRARTKLKQTEVDYEILKKYYKTLSEDNMRLKKELQELKVAPPLYMPFPATTLTMCPSCDAGVW